MFSTKSREKGGKKKSKGRDSREVVPVGYVEETVNVNIFIKEEV